MTTKQTVLDYFAAISVGEWEKFIAEDMTYGFNSSVQDQDRESYLQGAGSFLALVTAVELKYLTIEGNRAAVIARYTVQSPAGATGVFEVPEFLTVRDNQLVGSSIFFNGAAFAAFMQEQ